MAILEMLKQCSPERTLSSCVFCGLFSPSVPPYNGGRIWKRPMPSGRKLGVLCYTDNNSISFCGHAKIKRYECLNSIDFSFSYLECFVYS